MGFLYARPQKAAQPLWQRHRFFGRFFLMIACLALLTSIQGFFGQSSQTLAATRPKNPHSIKTPAISKTLKQRIQVKHTGHAIASTASRLQASAQPAYNNIGISDDNNQTAGNFDMGGKSYSEQDFQDPNGPGWNPGDTLTYQGIDYLWPAVSAGQNDNYVAAGQVIPVTPVAGTTTIGFVGSAENATSSSSGTATLTYTDGSTQTFSLGMTDWMMNGGHATPLTNNRLFAILPHYNSAQGQQAGNTYLFEMETALTTGKTLQSVTLPTSVNQGRLHVFMIGTRSSNDYMNNIGTSDNNSPIFANYDGLGNSYSIQALEAAYLFAGQSFFFNGVSFPWPTSASVIPDNYQAAGQTIPITPVTNANTLAFLGSATNGAASGTATITYSDATTQTFTLGFADWMVSPTSTLPYNDQVVTTMSALNTPTGPTTGSVSILYTEVAVQASKTIQSITLPSSVSGGQLHIFAMGTRAGSYNNAGSSDDTQPTYANYDGSGSSYSQQALTVTGLVPGQNVTSNGVTFTWPGAGSGLFNNYQTAGQTISVTPVSNATTLAFLGAATNGPSSGTATITYTDGSTQTFTLGFADWTVSSTTALPYGNSVASTMSYHNSAAGQQSVNTYLFFSAVTLTSGKTVQSVTLPTSVTQGQLHVFTIGTR